MSPCQLGGTLVSSTGDYYSWYSSDIYPYHTVLGWLGFKLGVLLASLFAFFFLSSVTALLVRVLISSGVVLLFPMFWALQYFGVQVCMYSMGVLLITSRRESFLMRIPSPPSPLMGCLVSLSPPPSDIIHP